MNFTLFKQLEIVNGTLRLVNTDYLAGLTVDYELILYGMAFMLA